jgi:hypothetical protein
MGYGVYFREGRWAGYGVPAVCDKPDCTTEIDRGLAYICGEEPGSEKGCGLFFCSNHLYFGLADNDPQMCERCCNEEPPYEPKADTAEWTTHMLTDDSWQQWRDENPEQVATMKAGS